MSKSRFITLFVLAASAHNATAQDTSVEKISLAVNTSFDSRASVIGELRVPASPATRLPAVLIVNSSTGFDGRGAFYAEALNQAGIATLEIDPYQGRGLLASPVQNLPHVFQSQRWLAAHPRIDPARIGVMGFSWGAQVALVASSASLAREHGGATSFAAHVALYPQCWAIGTARGGKDRFLQGRHFDRVTGPVHIFSGTKDDYDGPDGCRALIAGLPPQSASLFALTVYDATFAWDSRFGSTVYEAGASRGAGGFVNVVADSEVARRSREATVSYFKQHLAASR